MGFREEVRQEQRTQDEALAKLQAEFRQGQRSQDEVLEKMHTDMNLLVRQISELAERCLEVDHLKAALRDLAKRLDDWHREQDDARDKAVRKLREELGELSRQVGEMQGAARRLREDPPNVGARSIREDMGTPPPLQVQHQASTPPAQRRSPAPPEVATVVSDAAYAVLRNGDEEVYELLGLRNTVGRAASCDAVIQGSQAISNCHASISFDAAGNASVRDLGSRNGTFLNERRVPKDAGFALQCRDALQLGIDGPTYVFEYGPAYFARWPRNLERVAESGSQQRESTPPRVKTPGSVSRSTSRR